MARATVEPAVRDLLKQCTDSQEHTTTVSLGGDGFALYSHIRVHRATPDQAKVSVACWSCSMDAARYFGGNPPGEAETRLPPEGTASPDESLTDRVVRHLATLMNALDAPQPDHGGHLTITVLLPPRNQATSGADEGAAGR